MSDSEDQKSYYEKDGLQFPRVTHVIKILDKSGLARWRGKVGNQEADRLSREGSRIGSEFHAVAQQINQGMHQTRGWQAPGEFRFMAAAYIDWLHKYVAEIRAVEQTYFSNGPDAPEDEPRYAGTLDVLGVIRGDTLPSIIDVKTSKSYSDDWCLQLSGYRRLLTLNGIETARRLIVHVPKEGKIEAVTYDFKDHDEDEAAWMDALHLWQWQQNGKSRRELSKVIAGL